MNEEKEFEFLQRTLEAKSQQIQNLRTEIFSHQPVNLKNQATLEGNESSHSNMDPTNSLLHLNSTHKAHSSQVKEKHLPDSPTRHYQHHIEDLQRKLRLMTELCAEQEMNYKNAFKDMELNFHRTLSQRDEFIKLRESESNNQQQLISHLQTALEKLEVQKECASTDMKELSDSYRTASDQLKQQHEELGLFKKTFKSLSVILIPHLKELPEGGGDGGDFNELNIASVATMLEKVLLLHQKEKELLMFKIQNVESKFLDSEKLNEEKVHYEKKLMEVQHNERNHVYIASIESKDQDIKLLQEKILTLENEKAEVEKKIEFDVSNLKKDMEALTNENNAKCNVLCQEKNHHQQRLLECQTKYAESVETCRQLKLDVEKHHEGNRVRLNEGIESQKRMDNLTGENKILRDQFVDMEFQYKELQVSSKIEVENLKKQLSIQDKHLEERDRQKEELQDSLSKIKKAVRAEEKQRYEQEICQINEVMAEYKLIMKKADIDLEEKLMIIDANQKTIENLRNQVAANEQEVFRVQNDLQKHTNVLDQKDNRIINLQLKLSEFNEQLKSSKDLETHSSKQLQNTKNLNSDFQEKLNNYEKEKRELLQVMEKERYQCMIAQKEVNSSSRALIEKTEEIDRLQKKLRSVAQKLKMKHEQITARESEMKVIRDDSTGIQERYAKLEQDLHKLLTKSDSQAKEINKLNDEKETLMKTLEEKDNIQEKEVLALLDRLHGCQADILKLKTILKSSNSNAIKYASKTQSTVTKQRSEVDSLRTKITWMKEALDVSEKARRDLEEQMIASDKSKAELHQQLYECEDHNRHLSTNLSLCQQEIYKLHKTLELTAKKYTDVYALVERQEKALADKAHQDESKSMEVKRTLRKPLPVSLVSDKKEETPPENEAMQTAELLHLLEDVKGLLSSTLRKNSKSGVNEKFNSSSKTDNRDSVISSSVKGGKPLQELPLRKGKELTANLSTDNSTNNNTNKGTDKEPLIIISPITGSNTLKLNEYLDRHSTMSESLSSLNFSSDILKHQSMQAYSTPKEIPVTKPLTIDDTAASVYSDVDYTEDETQISDADTTQATQASASDSTTLRSTRDHGNKGSSSVELLQQNLLNLKQMGDDLTTNNREIKDMIKKHSKKLRKINTQ